jgi:outer membrane protein
VAQVFDKYQKTDEATETLKKEIEGKRKDIEKRREAINLLKQKLESQGVVMAEKEKAKMEEEVDAKISELKDITEKSNRELRERETQLTKTILKDIEEVVKAYGKDNGYDLILDSRDVLYGPEGMEVTNDIIKLMNEKGKKKGG